MVETGVDRWVARGVGRTGQSGSATYGLQTGKFLQQDLHQGELVVILGVSKYKRQSEGFEQKGDTECLLTSA